MWTITGKLGFEIIHFATNMTATIRLQQLHGYVDGTISTLAKKKEEKKISTLATANGTNYKNKRRLKKAYVWSTHNKLKHVTMRLLISCKSHKNVNTHTQVKARFPTGKTLTV